MIYIVFIYRNVFRHQRLANDQRNLKDLLSAFSSSELAISKCLMTKWSKYDDDLLNVFPFQFNSAWIEESNIKNYLEYKDQLINSSKTAAFKEAVQRIEEYISDPVVSNREHSVEPRIRFDDLFFFFIK